MDFKKIVNLSLSISIVFCAAGYFLLHSSEIICSQTYESLCNFGFGKQMFLGFGQFGIILLILRFMPKDVVKWWFYFAVWYVPLAALWIIFTPYNSGAFLNPSKDAVVFALGGIYMSVSIVIILVRLAMLKMQKKKKSR